MSAPVIVSLYDESGNMLRPWAEVGFTVYNVDLLNDNRSERTGAGIMHFVQADMFDKTNWHNVVKLNPMFIASFPPCTDLATCGSKHFDKKEAENPNYINEAMTLFRAANMIADKLGVPWFAENPRSMASTYWRKPDYKFNPCDYAGYLPEDDQHPRWPDYLPPQDRYNKETWIWSGNWFIMPPKRRLEPFGKDYPAWKKLGGKSAKTKQIRSETPRGFAQAVFEANARALWEKFYQRQNSC